MPMQMAGQDAGLSLAAGMGVLDRSSGSVSSVSCPSYPWFLCSDLRFTLRSDLRFTLRYRAPALRAGFKLGS